MKLYELSAAQITRGIHEGKFSASEVFLSCLARARELEPQISAMLTITEELVRPGHAVDEARASGKTSSWEFLS